MKFFLTKLKCNFLESANMDLSLFYFEEAKYQLKQITKTREKNVRTSENCILRKMSLKCQNFIFKFFLQNSLPKQAKVAE